MYVHVLLKIVGNPGSHVQIISGVLLKSRHFGFTAFDFGL